jgi:hypothetical protein
MKTATNLAKSRSLELLWLVLLVGGAATVFLSRLPGRLQFPSDNDQQVYLDGGRAFAEHFVFLARAPVYSAWLGAIYLAGGRDLGRTFLIEKILSLVLLSLVTAYLAFLLFDWRSGILAGIWVLNCKYLLFETNSSHTLAAILSVVSVLCFFRKDADSRLPFALFALFLSTQARSEMWVPLLAVIVYLGAREWWTRRRPETKARPTGRRRRRRLYWIATAAATLVLLVLFNLRATAPETARLTVAFEQNFAVNYVERYGLFQKFGRPWDDWARIYAEAMPGSPGPLSAAIHYPRQVLGHVGYNLKLTMRALPAMLLAWEWPVIMGLALVIYLGLEFLERRSHHLSRFIMAGDASEATKVWALTTCLVIPISLVMRAAARYYVPLIPVGIVTLIFIYRWTWNLIQRRGRTNQEELLIQ